MLPIDQLCTSIIVSSPLFIYLFILMQRSSPFSLGNWLKMKISRSIYTFALTQGDASAMYDALTNLVSREEEFRSWD